MAAALGLEDATPSGYRKAAANGSEPGPADLAAFEDLLSSRAIDVLIYNRQTEGAVPKQLRAAAERAGVPVVEVTETVAPGSDRLRRLAGRPAPPAGDRAGCDVNGQGGEPALVLEDVTAVRDGRVVWSEGTFSIPAGALVGVIGPNGSGKTTLLEMVLGMLPPASGRMTVLGREPHRGDPRIGYVPQSYTASIGEAIRCRDLVTLGLSGARWGLGRMSAAERARVDGALAAVGASEIAGRRMSRLSGGQQQRAAIAQALVGGPELLLLDEPLANLDVRNQQEIVGVLGRVQAGQHDGAPVTILVVAHDLNPLLSVLTSAVYLLDGHAHYGTIGDVVDGELLTHLYGTTVRVVKTPQGELFTRSR